MKRSESPKSELEKRLEERAAREAAQASDVESEPVTAAESNDTEPVELEAVEERMDALSDEVELWKDQLLRARAEFDNYRRRVARDAEKNRVMAAASIVKDLLPVLDHLEMALQHGVEGSGGLTEGVELVRKQLLDVLTRHGVEPIPALGEPFDPHVHEAMMRQHSEEYAADTVCEEFQRGYRLGGVVLRPSKVVVSAGPEPTAE
jgi:molecular chaperone GrpE